jgi:hypothetical protein
MADAITIITNELLSISLAAIGAFTNIVSIPPKAVPTTTNEIARFAINPWRPTEVYITHSLGTDFWIRDGTIKSFCSPGSYSKLQDPDLIPKFFGVATLTTNELIAFGLNIVRKLLKRESHLSTTTPDIRTPGIVLGTNVPFVTLSWPGTNKDSAFRYAVEVEIDARSSAVTWLDLQDSAFFDPAIASAILRTIFRTNQAAAAKESIPRKNNFPPSDQDVRRLLPKWTQFRKAMGFAEPKCVSIECVNWERSFSYTNRARSSTPAKQVRFNDSTCFEGIAEKVFGHYDADACFTGLWDERPAAEWEKFQGPIKKRWKDLVDNFEKHLENRFGLKRNYLNKFTPRLTYATGNFGDFGLKRARIGWLEIPRSEQITHMEDGRHPEDAFSAEFDLETGEIKFINIENPDFIFRIWQKLKEE